MGCLLGGVADDGDLQYTDDPKATKEFIRQKEISKGVVAVPYVKNAQLQGHPLDQRHAQREQQLCRPASKLKKRRLASV